MAVALGRPQSVYTSRGGAAKQSTCEAWFALNRRAYQAVLNMAIQAEMNMTSAEVTSRRRRDDVATCHELPAELMTPPSTLAVLDMFYLHVGGTDGKTPP